MKELSFEKSLFLYFNGKHSPFFDWLMSMVSNQLISIPVYLIFIFILIRTLKYLNTSYIITNAILVISCISLMVVVSRLVLPTIFEHMVSRLKPCYDSEVSSLMHLVGDKSEHHYGFYAFRACTAFAISTFLIFIFDESFKWVKFLLLVWAFFVAYSRIYLGAHYPADILVSVLSGTLLGYLIYRIYFYIKESVLVI